MANRLIDHFSRTRATIAAWRVRKFSPSMQIELYQHVRSFRESRGLSRRSWPSPTHPQHQLLWAWPRLGSDTVAIIFVRQFTLYEPDSNSSQQYTPGWKAALLLSCKTPGRYRKSGTYGDRGRISDGLTKRCPQGGCRPHSRGIIWRYGGGISRRQKGLPQKLQQANLAGRKGFNDITARSLLDNGEGSWCTSWGSFASQQVVHWSGV